MSIDVKSAISSDDHATITEALKQGYQATDQDISDTIVKTRQKY